MRAPTPATAEPLDRRSLLAGAGAVAIGGLLVGRSTAANALATEVTDELRLFATDLRHVIPGVEPGELPPINARAVPHAHVSSEDGGVAGTLASVAVPSTDGAAVLHTFTLNDGTILGIGPPDIAGPHAVVGGSGRYAGVSGTYTLRTHPNGHLILISLRKGTH